MLNKRWHYAIQWSCLFLFWNVWSRHAYLWFVDSVLFSQSLGLIPLKCMHLSSLTYIKSILETNSDHLFFCSLLKAAESHNVHLLSVFSRFINRQWGNLWVITTLDRETLPEAVVLSKSDWQCQQLCWPCVYALCLTPGVLTAFHKSCSSLNSHADSSSTCVTWMRLET